MTKFIFMLTYNDQTIPNAMEVYNEVRNTGVEFVGFKDIGLPEKELVALHKLMKKDGKTTFLEVVSASEGAAIKSAEMAKKLGVDYLIGGTYVDKTLPLLKGTKIKYFPYIGKIVGHPCLLRGTIEEITKEAKAVEKRKDFDGINLLAYRYDGDIEKLIKNVRGVMKKPLIVAGSINSFERIAKMKELDVWAYTIGGAILDKKFVLKGSNADNIKAVLEATK
jgi:hypothetical protein